MADPHTANYITQGCSQHEAKWAMRLVNSFRHLEGPGVVASILNKSSWDFTIANFETNHGDWEEYKPPPTLRSATSIIKLLRPEIEKATGSSPVSDQDMWDYLDQVYKRSGNSPTFLSAATTYAIRGAGIGSEGLVRVTPTDPACGAVIFLLIRKIPGGDFGAGVAIYDPTEVATWTLDKYGTKIMNFIKNAPATPPVTAEGEQFSEGPTKTAKNGPLKVTFEGAESINFVIENNY